MRSKDGSISFCTYHDPLPNNASGPKKPVPEPSKNPEPVIEADELAVRRQRREQSSRASQLIGQKMLQKWALLNENCPNSTCYAVNGFLFNPSFLMDIFIDTPRSSS